jgi:hypothetical protein
MTSFLDAVNKGIITYVKQQLKVGYSPNKDKDKKGNTPLLIASKNGFVEIAQALIAAGADLNATNNLGETSLIIATKNDKIAIIQTLTTAHANLNVKESNGNTALTTAIIINKLHIANLLINSGADIEVPGQNGSLPIDYAMVRAAEPLFNELIFRLEQIHFDHTGMHYFDEYYNDHFVDHGFELGPELNARINLGEDICGICQDNYNNGMPLVILSCKHIWHLNCVENWVRTRGTCPKCKALSTSSRPLTIDTTPGEPYPIGQYFTGGHDNYYNKLQKYINKLN